MTLTAPPTMNPTNPTTDRGDRDATDPAGPTATVADTRSRAGDVRSLPPALRSEWIKLSTLRTNRLLLALTVAVNAIAAWAVATLVHDEVLYAAEVFVFPALLTAVLAAVFGILSFTSEAQHGTLAATLAAQPARWVVASAKVAAAGAVGLVLGTVGMTAAFAGAVGGGLAVGDHGAMASTAGWTLLYTTLTALLGLGVGMIVRHGAGAVSGVLVWWFVVENLVRAFSPPRVAHVLPFDAGYRILEVGSDFDTAEIIATSLARPQYALVYGAYALAAVLAGTALLSRRDVA